MTDSSLHTDDGNTNSTTGAVALEDRPQRDPDAVIASALAMVDEALGRMLQRELVSSNEVTDVLLDLRGVLVAN
jgi:hypothetical protein